jgi:undecaprenyl-diphosphatase
MPEWLGVVLLGVVEGVTEFLPISSTGHLILVGDLLGFNDDKGKIFELVIQTGAMLAVVWHYREKFAAVLANLGRDRAAQRFVLNLAVAFLPAAVLGLAFGKTIKAALFKPVPVAIAFIAGAFVILWAERRDHRVRVERVDDMTWLDALKVGIAQCFALIPGTSRSGATIIGAMLFGFSRKAATEFSFFLAIPTVIGASVYSGFKAREQFVAADFPLYAIGFVAAFFAALVCVRWLLAYISNNDFRPFAWYRLAFGGVILLTAYAGWVDWTQ